MCEKTELVMLGTGHATVTKCYNTCFVLKNSQTSLLIDAGGGNGILKQLENAKIPLHEIDGIFVTHAHTDHLLGVVWVIRMFAQAILSGQTKKKFRIYSHDKVLQLLVFICRETLSNKFIPLYANEIEFREVSHNVYAKVGNINMQFFDIGSSQEVQFGFRAILPDNKILVCMGDEPYKEELLPFAQNADWLLHEAFCLYKDRSIYEPYEKNHGTALDAGRIAGRLKIKNLLLYHTEDDNLTSRKYTYTEEARKLFSGQVFVPDDLERITL